MSTRPTTCSRCGEEVARSTSGGFFAPGRAAAGAGHRAARCVTAPALLHVVETEEVTGR